ncbi:MAG: DUF2283 domain-containing protein [candidate division KSB1 bacterium]|nr:DUF2283 domain-containing protein [candidate division KSB1 bacterium]
MKIYYDASVDALYIEFRALEPGTVEAREISEDIVANYGPDGKLAGIEVLDASAVLGDALKKVNIEISPVVMDNS